MTVHTRRQASRRTRRGLFAAMGLSAAMGLLPILAAPPAEAAEAGQIFTFLQAEQLELRSRDGADSLNWDIQGWIGTDDHRAWLKTEGETTGRGRLAEAEIQLLYSRRLDAFYDLQAGLRYDPEPAGDDGAPARGFAVLGMQGLAPQWIEVGASAFVSHEGEVSARLNAGYDLYVTQRLVLQPAAELNIALQDVPERGVGSGVNDLELGLRLRYDLTRKIGPYMGVNWRRMMGQTARLAREDGEDDDDLAFVTGIRFRF